MIAGARLGSVLAAALMGACGLALPTPSVFPLSRVTVTNTTDEPRLARMTWVDDFVQVSRVEARTTSYLSGAIGTSGFPVVIEVLTEDCELIDSIPGLEPGSSGLLTIREDRLDLTHLQWGDASWPVAQSVEGCGATLGPPPEVPRTPGPTTRPRSPT